MIHPETHKVTEENGRCSAIAEEKCCWCSAPLGSNHKEDCVCRTRTVKMRVTIEYVYELPENWDKETIEQFYNQGSWCAINILDTLDRRDCLCDCSTFEYLGEATEQDEQEWGYAK